MTSFPLPPGTVDAVLNKGQLARALGKTEPTIERWMAAGMPVLEGGSHGKSYAFQLSHCYAWMRSRDAALRHDEEEQERAVRQMQLALIGGKQGDAERMLSPAERLKVYEAELRWQELAQSRGELVQAMAALDVIEGILAIVRQGLETMPDRLARECGLDGTQTEKAVRLGDDILRELDRVVGEFADTIEQREKASAWQTATGMSPA